MMNHKSPPFSLTLRSRAPALGLLVIAFAVISSCSNADTRFYVANESAVARRVAIIEGDQPPDEDQIIEVEARSETSIPIDSGEYSIWHPNPGGNPSWMVIGSAQYVSDTCFDSYTYTYYPCQYWQYYPQYIDVRRSYDYTLLIYNGESSPQAYDAMGLFEGYMPYAW